MRIYALIFCMLIGFLPLTAKNALEKELEKREAQEQKALKHRQEVLNDVQEKNQEKLDITQAQNKKKKSWFFFKSKEEKTETEKIDSKEVEKKDSKEEKIALAREELKQNEEKAINFVFQDQDFKFNTITSEKFFSRNEKQQLLELWRATLVRNRTIQFIIRSLSTDPENFEKNNTVLQVLSQALFVPFYAISAIADNTLIQGGTSVGARVIGDVVNSKMEDADQTKQVNKTDVIVLFMLVDEVAERLRNAYYSYKDSKIENKLISHEVKLAELDHQKALTSENEATIFFTQTVLRSLERKLRENKLKFNSSQRKLIELSGEAAVNSVDLLIEMEINENLSDILGV